MAYSLVSERTGGEPDKVMVTQGKIENLVAIFARTWQRPPTEWELEGLIQDYVREEVLYREALALGLDRDDTIVRRRLRQKLEFVTEDVAAEADPTDQDLRTYLKAHPETFRLERRFTFSQVYLNPDRHGENLARDAVQLLAQLTQASGRADVTEVGDPLLIDHKFDAVPGSEVAKQFGEEFAAKLGERGRVSLK